LPEPSTTPSISRRSRPHRILRIAKLTVALAWAASPRQLLVVVAATVIGSVITPLTLLATGRLIDGIAAHPPSWLDRRVLLPILALGALALLSQVLQAFISRLHEMFTDRVWLHAHKRFLAHVAAADLSLLDDPTWHDRLARARSDVGWRPANLTLTLIHILSSSLTLVTLCSALFILDPPLLALGVLSVLPAALLKLKTNQRLYDLMWQTTRREREHDYLTYVASEPFFSKDLRAFGLARHTVERARALSLDRLEQKRRLYREANQLDLVGGTGSAVILVVAYAFIADAGTLGVLSIGSIAAIFGAFTSLTGHLAATLTAFVTVDQHAQFLDDYFSFLAIAPTIKAPEHPRSVPAPVTHVVLDKVSFHYPGHEQNTLVDVDLDIRTGQIVALVGENGAGKSTLVKLLLRFFDPDAGTVRFGSDDDEVDAREVDPAQLRERLGVLFQDFGSYELEVKEVLRFGRVSEPFDEQRAHHALKAARADGIIAEIGHGLDSVVGRLFEGGHDLSGGQWQRLALARLIYRDADLWILDEPTANLDPSAEAEIFAELRSLLRGRMGIIISHRFSTVRSADQILVLEGGRVTERGTHDQLMAQPGRYAEMFAVQASGYR
jgi:ATP-binding cassette subfamily B protein